MTVEELAEQLRKALAHFEDPIYLETLPLLDYFVPEMGNGDMSRGQALRRELRLAIDALAPNSSASNTELDTRAHEVLFRYAISRQRANQISLEMGISDRQVYRELRRATQALAQVLHYKTTQFEKKGTSGTDSTDAHRRVLDELELISGGHDENTDIAKLLTETIDRLSPLADRRQIAMSLQMPEGPVSVPVRRTMLRQALSSLLSHLIARAAPQSILALTLLREPTEVRLGLAVSCQESLVDENPQSPYAIATELFGMMGMSFAAAHSRGEESRLRLSISNRGDQSVLLVDDNDDLLALFRRYLSQQNYRVHACHSFEEAVDIVERIQPAVVVLDVMMPGRDGWELLQTLRAREENYQPRVVVCSIVDDPVLSLALGADGFLKKPVGRQDLLRVLQDVLSDAST